MNHQVSGVLAVLIGLCAHPEPVCATDFTQLNVVRVRVASLSAIPCPSSHASDCLRVGVVVIFRQASGTEAGISTQYITGGTFVGDIRRDFGAFSPIVLRASVEALATAASGADMTVKARAQQFLPIVEAERSYRLAPGIAIPGDVETVIGKISDAFKSTTGKRLLVTSGSVDGIEFEHQPLTPDEKKGLSDAVLGIGGATLSETVTTFRVALRPAKLKLWLNAFIPGTISNLTFTLPGSGPHAGKTAIPGPLPGVSQCFLTDQRTFSSDPSAKHRMQISLEVDLAISTMRFSAHSDSTTRVDRSTGSVQCEQTARTDRNIAKNFSSETLANGDRSYYVTLRGAGNNPCFTPSPDIDWSVPVVVLFKRANGQVTITLDGLIEPFPAFEMYAIRSAQNPTVLFQEGPLPGTSPWNIPDPPVPGSLSRAVTVIAKEIP